MTLAAIAIGSNVGDRHAHLEHARRCLAALPRTSLRAFSTIHETAPVGPVAQGPFLNAAALIETDLSAADLLAALHACERAAGRVRDVPWGPRTLDLDIVLFGDCVIDEPGLCVPHPRMHERAFVLGPLSEIAPQMVHPLLGKTVSQLRAALDGAKSGGA
jgi:2-amino-4-hydroxy-6-hydroxymethyldihydropteridine diphosphokinase